MAKFKKDIQFYKFSLYGFLKNLRFFDPFIILFFLEQGISYLEIGILFSFREVAINVLEIPTGIFADSFGRRKSMILSFLSYIVSFFVFYFFPGFWTYLFAMLFFSFGEAFRTGTHKAMILKYLEIKGITHLKVEYYGYTRSFSQLGSALSSIIAMILVFYSGSYRIVFLASVVPYVLELFLMISYPKELDGELKKNKTFWDIFRNIKETTKNFFSVFKHPQILKALLNSSAFDGLFKSTKDYLQPVLKTYALSLPLFLSLSVDKRSAVLVGIVYFFIYLLTSYASKSAPKVRDRFKELRKAINWTFLIGSLMLFISGISLRLKLYLLSVLMFILFYVLKNIRRPLNVGFIGEKIKSNIMASGLSAESQLKTLFSAIFSFLMGFFAQYYGVDIAFISVSIISILSLFFVKV